MGRLVLPQVFFLALLLGTALAHAAQVDPWKEAKWKIWPPTSPTPVIVMSSSIQPLSWRTTEYVLEPGHTLQASLNAYIRNDLGCAGAATAAVQVGPVTVGIYPEARPWAPCQLGGNTDVYLVVDGPGGFYRVKLGDVCSQQLYSVTLTIWEDCNGTIHIRALGYEWSFDLPPGSHPISVDYSEDANPMPFCDIPSSVDVRTVGRRVCPVDNLHDSGVLPPVNGSAPPSEGVSFGSRPDQSDESRSPFGVDWLGLLLGNDPFAFTLRAVLLVSLAIVILAFVAPIATSSLSKRWR